jgi:N-acetylglucosamine kinase
LCADVGGSFVDMGIVGARGEVLHRTRYPTPLHDWEAFVALFRQALADHAALLPADSPVCLATAGLVHPRTGVLTSANIASLHGRALATDLGAAIGRRVSVINDADAFALAEASLGAGRGHRRVFAIILGTGVGGGLIEDGHVLVGAHGIGGEWGHGEVLVDSPVAPGAVPVFACGCGRRGCLDTIGSARGLERLHAFLHDGAAATSIAITDGWQAGDPACAATVDYYARLVAGPIAMFLNSFPADIVPVGGGLANCVPLIALLDARVRYGLLERIETPVLVPTALRDRAGLLGAALASGVVLDHAELV